MLGLTVVSNGHVHQYVVDASATYTWAKQTAVGPIDSIEESSRMQSLCAELDNNNTNTLLGVRRRPGLQRRTSLSLSLSLLACTITLPA